MASTTQEELPGGLKGLVHDWAKDETTYNVPWPKAMMWIFLLGDTFVFGIFLAAYAAARAGANIPWPNASEVFALHVGGTQVPLLLIAIMTFILISSSGFMALAVNYGYARDKNKSFLLVLMTAIFGLIFVGMQALEWATLIGEGVRPWENPFGAHQFGATFFMLTGFHGFHVLIGVIYLFITALRIKKGSFEKADDYTGVEVAGLYWHFVDLVWVFIFAFFYLF